MKIIISPFSRKRPNGECNAKDYPDWQSLVNLLRSDGHHLIQVGQSGEQQLPCQEIKFDLSISELREVLLNSDTFISVDNFFPHFAAYYNKRGIVIFGKSDPRIYGHELHINVLKSRNCLRLNQFDHWHSEPHDAEVFVKPFAIMNVIRDFDASGDFQ